MNREETWSVLDSTKIMQYMNCPRRYFFEYILHWRPERPNVHLVFGEAWHLAMEHLLLNGYTDETIAQAYSLFLDKYREYFAPEWDESNKNKSPNKALAGLLKYAKTYGNRDTEKVLYTEIAGSVMIAKDRLVYFKMDSILERSDGSIMSREHKTGTTVSRQWLDQWVLSVQTGMYSHVLHCLYKDVWGVEINGVFFGSRDIQLQRVPVRRSPLQMQVWLTNTNTWVEKILLDTERLLCYADDEEVMQAFPMCTTNCTQYFGCVFHDLCRMWENPWKMRDELPHGFKREAWDPRDEVSKAKMKLAL